MLLPSRSWRTDCSRTYFVLNKYYYIIILYGGSHASDILHVLMGVSVAKLIIYNIVLLFICHNKRSSSSSSSSSMPAWRTSVGRRRKALLEGINNLVGGANSNEY